MSPRPVIPTRATRRGVETFAVALAAVVTVVSIAPPASAGGLGRRQTARLLSEGTDALASARRQLQQGHKQVAAGRIREAARAFGAVLQDDENNRGAAVGMASIYFLTNRHAEAVELLEPLADRFPDDLDLAHQLGLNLYRMGRQDDAMALLARAAADPARFDAMWLLAIHHYRRANWGEGLPWAERYAAARPEDTRALGLLGTLYLKNGRHDDAIEALDRFLREHPENVAAQINRANALLRTGREDDAATAYEGLLREHPERLRVAYNLAAIRIRQDRCEDAVPLLERFVGEHADHATALYFKGDCEVRLGRADAARATMARVVELTPSNPWAHHALARLEYALGALPVAIDHARKAAEVSPDEWEIATALGTLLRRSGDPEEALAWHDRAVASAPDQVRSHTERGRDLWALSRVEDASQAFGRAVEAAPDHEPARAALAASLTALAVRSRDAGEIQGARTLLERALEASPGYPAAVVNQALLELGEGAIDAAANSIAQAPTPATADVEIARAAVRLAQGDVDGARAAADSGLASGTSLTSLGHEIRAHAAASEGDWSGAVEALDRAFDGGDGPRLDAARSFAQLALGLQQLASSDARAALTALDRAHALRAHLQAIDVTLLEFARAAARVATNPKGNRSVAALESLVKGRKLGRRTALKDRGWLYVAWARLAQGNFSAAQKALGRVRDKAAAKKTVGALDRAIRDAEGRGLFSAGKHAKALKAWSKAAGAAGDPVMAHNVAAARFAQGDVGAARATWDAQRAAAEPAEALYNLAILADREGRYRDAYQLFKAYTAKSRSPLATKARKRLKAKERVLGLGGGS